MPKRNGPLLASSGSGLPNSSLLSTATHPSGRVRGTGRIDDDAHVEVMGAREEEERRNRLDWEEEMGVIAATLAADFPLLDTPLILSLISDLNPAELSSSVSSHTALEGIRETLGILEAGIVADLEEQGLEVPGRPAQHGEEQDGAAASQQHETETETTEATESSSAQMADEESAASGPQPAAKASKSYGRGRTRKAASPHTEEEAPAPVRTPGILAISRAQVEDGVSHASKKKTKQPKRPGLRERRSRSEGGETFASEFRQMDIADRTPHKLPDEDGPEVTAMDKGEMFLMEMFPTLPHSTFEDVLKRATSAEDGSIDMLAAIEDLLSFETIRDVDERGSWDDKPEDGGADTATTTTTTTDDEASTQPTSAPSSPRQSRKPKIEPAGPQPTPERINLTVPMYRKLAQPSSPSISRQSSASGSTRSPAVPKAVNILKQETTGSRYAAIARDYASASSASEDESGNESVASKGSRRTLSPAPSLTLGTLKRRNSHPPRTDSRTDKTALDAPASTSWHPMTSLATYLSELLGHNQPKATSSHFLSFFHSASYVSGYAAMKAGLQALMVPRAAVADALMVAPEILGLGADGDDLDWESLDTRKDLEICVRAARGDVGIAMDILTILHEVRSWQAEGPDWAHRVLKDSIELEIKAGLSAPVSSDEAIKPKPPPQFPPSPQRSTFASSTRKVQHPQNWRTVSKAKSKKKTFDHPLADYIPSYSRGATPQDTTPGSLFDDGSRVLTPAAIYDLNVCRRRAAEERRKREEAMRQAGRYFKINTKTSGMGTGKEVAAFYAAEARKYESSARLWELRAAREVVKQQSAHHDKFCIDIHHLTLAEATTVVLESVADWHASQNFVALPSKPFQVITGVGKHSPGHVGVLLPAVSNVLVRNGWKVDRGHAGRGYLLVRGLAGS